jgi:hypothetical protein
VAVLAAHWSYVGRQATIAIILTTDGKYQDPPEFYLYLPLHFMRTSDMIMSAPAQTPENITHIQNGPARYTGQPGELVAQNERDSVRNDKKVLSRRRDETRTRRNNVVTLIIFHWHYDTCFQCSSASRARIVVAAIPCSALTFLSLAWYVLWPPFCSNSLRVTDIYVEMHTCVTRRTRSEWKSGMRGWVQVTDVPGFRRSRSLYSSPGQSSRGIVCSHCLLCINELRIR